MHGQTRSGLNLGLHRWRPFSILLTAMFLLGGGVLFSSAAEAANQCTVYKGNSYQRERTCVYTPTRVGAINGSFISAFSDSFYNGTTRNITTTCTMKTSRTLTFSISGGGEASASAGLRPFIQAEAKLRVDAGIKYAIKAAYSTSAQFTVRPKKTGYCHRGVAATGFQGRSDKVIQRKSSSGWKNFKIDRKTYTGLGPKHLMWRITGG